MPGANHNTTPEIAARRLGLPAPARQPLDEVTAAKLSLMELGSNDSESFSIVRRHPLASIGVAFMCGMIVVRSSTVRTLSRAGLHTGMTTLITRTIRAFF